MAARKPDGPEGTTSALAPEQSTHLYRAHLSPDELHSSISGAFLNRTSGDRCRLLKSLLWEEGGRLLTCGMRCATCSITILGGTESGC
jgi:hypothetical protein